MRGAPLFHLPSLLEREPPPPPPPPLGSPPSPISIPMRTAPPRPAPPPRRRTRSVIRHRHAPRSVIRCPSPIRVFSPLSLRASLSRSLSPSRIACPLPVPHRASRVLLLLPLPLSRLLRSTYTVSFMHEAWAVAQVVPCIHMGNCPSSWATAQEPISGPNLKYVHTSDA